MAKSRKSSDYVDEWKELWESDLEAIAYNGATCDPTRVDPKVLHWVKRNCAHKPHFIKVINETAACGWRRSQGWRLSVPRPFVREYFPELGRVVTLEDAIHRKWKVSFGSAAQKNSAWMQGWRRLARDNRLKSGDVMIFVLIGHSHFHFHLFDEDGELVHPHVHRKSTSNVVSVAVKAKTEPIENYQSYQEHSLSDSEQNLKYTKRKLFDSGSNGIVKMEPGLERPLARTASSERATSRFQDGHGVIGGPVQTTTSEQVSEPPGKKSKVGRFVKTEESCQFEGTEEPAKRKLEIERTDIEVKIEELSLANSGLISHQTSSPPRQEMNPPSHELLFDPLSLLVRSRRRMTAPIERKRAKEVAKAHAELLIGYRFVVIMSEAQVYRDFHLVLPDRFVSESSFPTSLTKLSLVDCTGKAWEMHSRRNSCNQVAFHRKYWGIFALEHFLEEGDVCLFQLKKKDSLSLLVRIFRVVQLPKVCRKVGVHDHYDLRVKIKS